jgi:hypothetical protein
MTNQGIIQPLTCPTCGGIIALQVPERSYCCPLGHCFSNEELDTTLQQMLRLNLNRIIRQVQDQELLQHKMVQHGLRQPAESNNLLPLAQQLLAALPPGAQPGSLAGQ